MQFFPLKFAIPECKEHNRQQWSPFISDVEIAIAQWERSYNITPEITPFHLGSNTILNKRVEMTSKVLIM